MYIFKLLMAVIPVVSFGQGAGKGEMDQKKAFMFYEQAEVYKQGAIIQLALYDSAIKYDPYNPDFYFKKSIWYKKSGKFIQSFEILDKAIELSPSEHLGYRAWSKLYFLRDFEGCLEDINILDPLTPNFIDYPWGENMFYLKGLCYMELNNFNKAIDHFNIAHREDNDIYSLHYKGVCFYMLGEIEKSLQTFISCLEIYNKLPDTFYYMASCHQILGNKAKAIQEVDHCNQLYNSGYRFTLPFIQPFKTIYQSDIDALKKIIQN